MTRKINYQVTEEEKRYTKAILDLFDYYHIQQRSPFRLKALAIVVAALRKQPVL